METTMDVTPREVLSLYQAGQRSGFIAGVAVCMGLKYLYHHRKKLQEYYEQARTR